MMGVLRIARGAMAAQLSADEQLAEPTFED